MTSDRVLPAPATHVPETTPSKSARDASRGSAIRLAAEIVIRPSSIIATLWLTRSLGVAPFGLFVLALSIGLMIAELSDLGLNAVSVPLLVRDAGNLRALLRLKCVLTAGVALICVPLIPLVSWVSGVDAVVLTFCSIHFLGASWIEIMGSSLRALGRRVDEAVVLFVFRFALVALVIGSPFGLTLPGAALSYAASVPLAIAYGMQRLHADWAGPRGPRLDDRAILGQALPMGVNGALAILSTRIELFFLKAFHGEHLVGLFGGPLRIIDSLLTLPAAIAAGALPSLARDVVQGSRGAAQRTFGLVAWIGIPAAAGLALCAPDVLRVLGPGFVEGAGLLRVLSMALFLCFANSALFSVLIGAGQTAVIPRLTAIRVGAAVVLSASLVPGLGAEGAGLSFTASEAILFALLIRASRPHAHIDVLRPVGWALVSCLPMAAVLLRWSMPLPAGVVIGAALFGLTAFAVLRRGTLAAGLA